MTRQRRCRICHERPPWHGKNCPPGICKRCYHREIWVDRPAARRERLRAERAASTDPLADFAGPLVYDGYLDAFRLADLFSSRRSLAASRVPPASGVLEPMTKINREAWQPLQAETGRARTSSAVPARRRSAAFSEMSRWRSARHPANSA